MDLDLCATGTIIVVGNVNGSETNEWVRDAEGWRLGTTVLGSEMFAGLAAMGLVTNRENREPIPGMWFRTRVWFLWVLEVDETRKMVRCVSFSRNGADVSEHEVPLHRFSSRDRYVPLSEPPVELMNGERLQNLLFKFAAVLTERQRLTDQLREARKRPDPAALIAEADNIGQATARLITLLRRDL